MIKSEAGSLTGWVYVDVVGSDIGSYVNSAKAAVAASTSSSSLAITSSGRANTSSWSASAPAW